MSAFSTEERQLLDDSFNEYFRDNYGATHAVALARSGDPDGFGRKEWSDYADLGWLGLTLPEAAGGSEGGLTEAGIFFAAAGRYLAQEPLVQTLVLGAGSITRLGTPEQQKQLKEIAEGKLLVGFLHAELASGYDRSHVTTIAQPIEGGFRLTGEKAFAVGAHSADILIVSARIGDAAGPVGLFLVPADTDNMQFTVAPAIDGRRGAAVRFEDAELGKDALLGNNTEDRTLEIDTLLDHGTLAVCADALGAMVAATEITTEYLNTREQFGRKLADFQVLQHRVADMKVFCEEARVVIHAALTAVDEGAPDANLAIWRAKVQTARAARFIGGQGIQLHGGMGMTDEMPIGHYYKRLTMCEAMFGDAEWHLDRLASMTNMSVNGSAATGS
ncbi:acyl-CoA dehydrogenase family protein [Sneathiella litorea]|uniref:Pimeloyl-CoA dehydrogenase small subunit n=1 Tax=Sneathiella litorea TaxID=2606216 RepID=A0A6L8W6G0_9PROT|nr:acyl-CoA dehydrogenase family protein [Sneathiella litorea]MZR30648.1 pimeloyl-CoA dehydrogenase small subunit [Sneathiella litorea]